MKRPGRALSPGEAELWSRVARTVDPMAGKDPVPPAEVDKHLRVFPGVANRPQRPLSPSQPALGASRTAAEARRPSAQHGLDAGWDRKLARGAVQPDFTLDLHGATLDAAYIRLEHGLTQALAQGARIVLLVTGRERPSDDHASRSTRRGAIRAKFTDWLTYGPHASRIAAIRPAHPRHGGAGAVYLVLRRWR